MSERTAARLAWGTLGVIVVLAGAEAAVVARAGGGPDVTSLLFLAFPIVGALVAARQPRNAVGWVLLGIGGLYLVSAPALLYWWFAPGLALPGAEVALAITSPIWVPLIGMMGGILPLIFPDGHLPSRRWQPVLAAIVTGLVGCYLVLLVAPGPLVVASLPERDNPLGIAALEPYAAVVFGAIMVVPLSVVVAVVALVRRFRRAHGRERLQLKWFVASVTFVGLTYGVIMLLHVPYGGQEPPAWIEATRWVVVTFVFIPAAIGVAILRHRLYDIDHLINRAVVYTVVTAVVSALYLVAVTVAQGALRPVTGGSELAVASSTLVAAAALRPVRRGVQTVTDRRFNRSRYDAARTTARFAAGLRRQTDLDELSRDLPRVVSQVLQPAHVSLWLPTPMAGGRVGQA